MKRNYFLTLLFIASLVGSVKAEIIYTDIPDETLAATGNIDINFDNTGVAEFTFENLWGELPIEVVINFSPATVHHFVTISTAKWDKIKGLPISTPINNSSGWYDAGDAYITAEFPTTGDSYIGAQFKLNGNTHFGWIRVNWDGTDFIVKDYAYENTPDTSINAGDKTNSGNNTDVKSNSDIKIQVYPNPIKDVISITSSSSVHFEAAKIISIEGQLIKNLNPSNRIDVSFLKAGTYILSLTDKNGTVFTKNIIKQ